MEYIVEKSIREFMPWSGGCYTYEDLRKRGDLEVIEEIVDEYNDSQETPITETEINDLLWFEPDNIAVWLGYKDWEEYLAKNPLDDEDNLPSDRPHNREER